MNNVFTEKIRTWLETPSDERDLAQGALYLLQLSGNKIMYQNVSRNLMRNADIIDYQLRKYLNFRIRELTHEQVEDMQKQVDQIVIKHFSHEDSANSGAAKKDEELKSSTSSTSPKSNEFKKGKREDHDSLPLEIQSCYVENLSIMQKMREVHLKLRTLSTENATCPDSERYPFLKELIKLDKQYHHNWDVYDHFVIGSVSPDLMTTEDDPIETSKSATRVVNLMKGKYKKKPSEELKAKILDSFHQILEPSDKLVDELTELGIL